LANTKRRSWIFIDINASGEVTIEKLEYASKKI
jgi:hypothetical protein